MIEIILVLLILSVLFFALRNIFQIKDKDSIYGQTCVEKLYGNIDSFVDAAIRSKGISSGSDINYPDIYKIIFSPNTNTIKLQYSQSGSFISYQTFPLTGNMPGQRYCQGANYNVVLSGSDIEVDINKGLSQNSQLQSFILSGVTTFTGNIDVMQCAITNPICKHIARFFVDTRTQVIQKFLCLSLDSGGNCNPDGRDK